MDYDPFDPAIHADPDPHFAGPAARLPGAPRRRARLLHRGRARDDITEILRAPQLWSSRFRNGLAYGRRRAEPMLLDADPPTHTWQRRLLQKAWTPRLIKRLEPRVRAVARRALDAGARDGPL